MEINNSICVHFECSDDNGKVIVLDEPFKFEAFGKKHTIECGYRSNGMSVPRAFWSIISPQFDPITLVPSVCHDWLYENHVCTRECADKWYMDALIANGFPVAKAKIVYLSLRMFGESHWNEK